MAQLLPQRLFLSTLRQLLFHECEMGTYESYYDRSRVLLSYGHTSPGAFAERPVVFVAE